MLSAVRYRLAICVMVGPLASGLRSPASPCRGSALEAIESFEVSPRKGMIVLPVTIGDERYQFALDSGCSVTVFDHRLRPKLGETVGDVPVNDKLVAKACRWPVARIGSMNFACATPVICLDTTDLRERTGLDLSGLIGLDWLSRSAFEFDPDEGRISFLSAIKNPPAGATVAVPIEEFAGLVYVKAEAAGLGKLNFLVDTGFTGPTMLLRGDIQRLAVAGKVHIRGTRHV